MKKYISNPLVFILILFCLTVNGQAFDQPKDFWSTQYFRLGAIIGYDLSWAGDNGNTALMSTSGSIPDDQIYYAGTPNQTFFLGLDAYDPTGTLGFIGGVGLNFQEYSIRGQNGALIDSIKTTNIEIPVYARLRFGKVLSRGQFWLALGGGYSINTQAEIIQKKSDGTIIATSEENKQFNSQPFVSSIIGYEIQLGSDKGEEYSRDAFRVLLYAKANYDLGNRLDEDNILAASAINTYSEPTIEFLRISVGIKVLLRLSKAGEILGESLKESLNK